MYRKCCKFVLCIANIYFILLLLYCILLSNHVVIVSFHLYFDLPHWRTSQSTHPQYLDQSQTSGPRGTLWNKLPALHRLASSLHFFCLARLDASVFQFLWKHFSGAAGVPGSASRQDWLHQLDRCTDCQDQLEENLIKRYVESFPVFQSYIQQTLGVHNFITKKNCLYFYWKITQLPKHSSHKQRD